MDVEDDWVDVHGTRQRFSRPLPWRTLPEALGSAFSLSGSLSGSGSGSGGVRDARGTWTGWNEVGRRARALGPLLGHVTATNAKVWLQASGPALLSVVVGQQENLSDRAGFKAILPLRKLARI